jgi:hypothetical protein
MSDRYRLKITLVDDNGEVLVEEVASCDSIGDVLVELGSPRGYTGQRFLDMIDSLFLRGARSPKIEFNKEAN